MASASTDAAIVPSFHIHTLGCKVNRAESETIAAALMERGWRNASPSDADVIIVNTCTVTGEADHKNRKLIRSLLKQGTAPVIVTGCAINVDADFYADLDARVICEKDKQLVPALAQRLAAVDAATDVASSPTDLDLFDAPRSGSGFRTRVDVKIQDGCDNACTYCIVHTARGRARSVEADRVIATVDSIARAGTKEVVLVGIDLGAYRSQGLDLAGLLTALQEQTSIGRVGRVRISSLEPQNLSDCLIDVLAHSDGRICRHLHLCLQSGSDKVLSEMHRHYTRAEFLEKVRKVRKAVPGIALSTDVIVGFPGETDEDFADTCSLVEECGFMRLHVFRYSKRPGTPAAARTDQVSPTVIAKRADVLRTLGARLAQKDRLSRIGTTEQVVVERPGVGTSESYHKVFLPERLEPGSLVAVCFSGVDEGQQALIGTLA